MLINREDILKSFLSYLRFWVFKGGTKKNAQFVIISLRNNMFELADRLVGIYKTHNTTKSVTIDPQRFLVGNNSAGAGGNSQQPAVMAVT